jgi:hypothetical protein
MALFSQNPIYNNGPVHGPVAFLLSHKIWFTGVICMSNCFPIQPRYLTSWLKARIVEEEGEAIARLQSGKHVSAAAT